MAPLVSHDDELAAAQASVLVMVQDPAAQPAARDDMLHQLYGFTRAEARLARALASGHSLTSASAAYGIRIGTACTQLKALFRKLGVSRQQDLVRMLCSATTMTGVKQ